MTSEATPFRRQPAGRADRRLRARLLPRHPRRRGRPPRRKRSGAAALLRLERPAPVERTSPGPGRRDAGRLRGRVAGRGRPRMGAVGGLLVRCQRVGVRPTCGGRTMSKLRNAWHVVKDGDDWTVKRAGGQRASSRHPTQREAEAAAKRVADNQGGGEITIHRPV